MELSREQVGRIDEFLRHQRVRFIDLRMELTDHIATEIESNNQSSGYDAAIEALPRRYYQSQLTWIKDIKALELGKFWDQELKSFWRSYLTLPKISITILLILTLYMTEQLEYNFFEKSLLTLINFFVSILGFAFCGVKLLKTFTYKGLLFENSLYAKVLLLFWCGSQMHELTGSIGLSSGNLIAMFTLALFTAFQIITLIGLFTSFTRFINSKMKMTYGLG